MKHVSVFIQFSVLAALVSACGVPAVPLSVDQRKADLDWIFATFDRNYAPLEYKQTKHGFTLAQVKAECYAKNAALATGSESNGKFQALAHECVAKFKDAHTSMQQMGVMTAGKARVAFLGFKAAHTRVGSGDSKVEALLVTGVLPTTNAKIFPIKKDDIIIQIDGGPVGPVLLDLVRTRDLGLRDASLNVAARSFAIRSSMVDYIPTTDSVVLTVKRGSTTFTQTLPWIVKDYAQYSKDLEDATKKDTAGDKKGEEKQAAKTKRLENLTLKKAYESLVTGGWGNDINIFNSFKTLLGKFAAWEELVRPLQRQFQGFVWLEPNPAVLRLEMAEKNLKGEEEEEDPDQVRGRDYKAVQDITIAPFPAYLIGDVGGPELVGYIRIESFELTDDDVATFAKLIGKMNQFHVKGIIVDMLDNGGGNLVQGMRMADLLTSTEVERPAFQFMLNDDWFDSFRSDAESAPTDAEKEWARRIVKAMEEDFTAGKRLSRSISGKFLDVYGQTFSADLHLRSATPVVLLVNEMCASMCDIFSAMVRDNGLGKIVGSETMGAGGNVVMHVASPSNNFMLNQTQSLVVDASGAYLENNGVKPDYAVDTVADRAGEYRKTLIKGLSVILGREASDQKN